MGHKTQLSVSQRIKQFRKLKQFSVADFARCCNTSDRNIYNYESGSTEPRLSFFQDLIAYFPNANLNYLIGGVGELELAPPEKIDSGELASVQTLGEFIDLIQPHLNRLLVYPLIREEMAEIAARVHDLENEKS